MSNEKDSATWPGRWIVAGTPDEPYGLFIEIRIGTTFPDEFHQKIVDLCKDFIKGTNTAITKMHPTTQTEATVIVTELTRNPDWEAPNVH